MKHLKRFNENFNDRDEEEGFLADDDQKYQVWFQAGTEEEGTQIIGEFTAKDQQEAIDKGSKEYAIKHNVSPNDIKSYLHAKLVDEELEEDDIRYWFKHYKDKDEEEKHEMELLYCKDCGEYIGGISPSNLCLACQNKEQ
jgi:hypothetical protein